MVGTRSALFLPLKELGLIIVDEEHDFSYKSHQSPMYNARDLCLYLSHKFPIQVILGSATPSLSSYKRFKDKALVRLKGRYTPTQKTLFLKNRAFYHAQTPRSTKTSPRQKRASHYFCAYKG